MGIFFILKRVGFSNSNISLAILLRKHLNVPSMLKLHPITAHNNVFSCSCAEKSGLAMCVGCGSQIHDQYILRVSPDLEWHAACLKCVECNQYLDETCTCFVRDGKTYCKRDYVR